MKLYSRRRARGRRDVRTTGQPDVTLDTADTVETSAAACDPGTRTCPGRIGVSPERA